MKYDYIIVGSGLASIMFAEQLRLHNKSFLVISNRSQQASVVASGLYNPVVLKRFTVTWNAAIHLESAIPKYAALEQLLGLKLDYVLPIHRVFNSVKEQNNWFLACDKPLLTEFLNPKLVNNANPSVKAPFGFGAVNHTGRIDTQALIEAYRDFLINLNQFKEETFEHNDLIETTEGVEYHSIKAHHIVFTEGFGIHKNPFFKHLQLEGTKGELITIHAPALKLESILKSSIFVIPMVEDRYLVGSTYEWTDKTNDPTEAAKTELLEKLERLIDCEFEVIDQRAGIRPTVVDRRPLVGQHPNHKSMYVLNGLGTRGVLVAPSMAEALYDSIEKNTPLAEEIDINRFA
ncbi:FAD-dependent oxidoreductase [Formosa sp. Hel1_33_131]|mgnify:FL=1|uniref:NAD(P)/FAD-dependent oxidoreductase n=1 Tax=Formosa sp. Hel1_33_131 TaxID=1336794 RepID=UPI00084E30EF|nr:FAD-dependent oxidoreductase [Formosa sp. Hel1_33_131]AOR28686.1 FAD-dependent oxidoreductase [Formosa sp. Hel1_33_131]